MSWQHHRPGGEPVVPEVVYDPNQAAHAYDGYGDPAAAHGWQEPGAEDDTAPLPPVPATASASDTAGRDRGRRLGRTGGIALGAGCAVVLGVVATGLLASGPSDGQGATKQRAEHTAPATTGPAPTTSEGATPSGPASVTPSGTASAAPEKRPDDSPSPTLAPSRATTAAPTTTAPDAAPARGNSGDKPGRGNGGPGGSKGSG
ncbi:hypothetical protein ACYBSK_32590 [Streptomyces sp. BYX5S]